MSRILLHAPAKVNFRLDVLRRRPDGYHDLRMIMQRVDLCDVVEISLISEPVVRVRCRGDLAPEGEKNIAWRAARALLAAVGGDVGIEITISKRIPVAAGLGGGSSDAATVLLGVNELLDLGLETDRLRAIGVGLGADVPFFILGRPALAEGIGERLTPLDGIPLLWLVLVNPGVEVSTAWVYQNLQLTSRLADSKIPSSFGGIEDVAAILANDLEQVTIQRFPVIAGIKERLMALGAHGALMSGSGATVFGIFADEATARQAAAEIGRVEPDWFVTAVRTLP